MGNVATLHLMENIWAILSNTNARILNFLYKQNQKFIKTIDLRRQDILDGNFYHEIMAKEPINSDMFIIYQEGKIVIFRNHPIFFFVKCMAMKSAIKLTYQILTNQRFVVL